MSYHFIGIGGIGMSSLAKLLSLKDKKVKGSDLSSSQLLDELRKKDAKIFKNHSRENILEDDIVVFSSAIDQTNEELLFAREKKLKVIHRSDLLNEFISSYFSLLVAGSHGKTTTSSLLTQVFIDAGKVPTYALGGILSSTNTNADLGKSEYFIVEADESDGSFLKYNSQGAIILNVDKEHLNYWKTFDKLKEGFLTFAENVKQKDLLIWCYEDEVLRGLSLPGLSYGFSKEADIYADNISHVGSQMVFDIVFQNRRYSNVRLNLIGKHNVLNALSVFALAKKIQIDDGDIFKSFASFQGVKRRMEKIGEVNKTQFFEDYGHHPSEIKATLTAVRQLAKERRIITVFQPHRQSRVEGLLEEFASCFEDSDELIITDVYRAGEKEKDLFLEKVLEEKVRKKSKNCRYVKKENLEKVVLDLIKPHDLIIFFGAGDISQTGKDIFKIYQKNPKKLKVALLFGGKSSEHEVAKCSAKSIFENLDKLTYDVDLFYVDREGYWAEVDNIFDQVKSDVVISSEILKKLRAADIAIPVFHGPCGEDGMIQGFLETLNIAYVGADYRACNAAMNKAWVKYIAVANNIKTLDFIEINKNIWDEDKDKFLSLIREKFTLPIFVKPSHLGSSIGVMKINDFDQLQLAIESVMALDDSLIVEKGIVAREIEVAVIGNTFIEAAEVGEVLTGGDFYDYEKKYASDCFLTKTPADISKEDSEKIKKIAKRVYNLLGCSGMSRIDFFYTDDELFLNEVNPIPGFTLISLFPKMWNVSNLAYVDLLDRLIILGLSRKKITL